MPERIGAQFSAGSVEASLSLCLCLSLYLCLPLSLSAVSTLTSLFDGAVASSFMVLYVHRNIRLIRDGKRGEGEGIG